MKKMNGSSVLKRQCERWSMPAIQPPTGVKVLARCHFVTLDGFTSEMASPLEIEPTVSLCGTSVIASFRSPYHFVSTPHSLHLCFVHRRHPSHHRNRTPMDITD